MPLAQRSIDMYSPFRTLMFL